MKQSYRIVWSEKKKTNTKSKNPTYGKDKQTKTSFLTKFALCDSKKYI